MQRGREFGVESRRALVARAKLAVGRRSPSEIACAQAHGWSRAAAETRALAAPRPSPNTPRALHAGVRAAGPHGSRWKPLELRWDACIAPSATQLVRLNRLLRSMKAIKFPGRGAERAHPACRPETEARVCLKNRHLTVAHIALALQGLQRSGLKPALQCLGGREIAAWTRAASAATASCNNDLEVPTGFLPACANMRGIDAHDEFAFWVIRQVQLHLAVFSR